MTGTKMECVGCGAAGITTHYGTFCDACGGVVVPGPEKPKLIYRHVATVRRPTDGHLFLVMYDASTSDYCVSYPAPPPMLVVCVHCGKRTPGDPAAFIARRKAAAELGILDPVNQPKLITHHGSLDAVIAHLQPIARGEDKEAPSLSPSVHATPEEMTLIHT